jgi:hypothetical protein
MTQPPPPVPPPPRPVPPPTPPTQVWSALPPERQQQARLILAQMLQRSLPPEANHEHPG